MSEGQTGVVINQSKHNINKALNHSQTLPFNHSHWVQAKCLLSKHWGTNKLLQAKSWDCKRDRKYDIRANSDVSIFPSPLPFSHLPDQLSPPSDS